MKVAVGTGKEVGEEEKGDDWGVPPAAIGEPVPMTPHPSVEDLERTYLGATARAPVAEASEWQYYGPTLAEGGNPADVTLAPVTPARTLPPLKVKGQKRSPKVEEAVVDFGWVPEPEGDVGGGSAEAAAAMEAAAAAAGSGGGGASGLGGPGAAAVAAPPSTEEALAALRRNEKAVAVLTKAAAAANNSLASGSSPAMRSASPAFSLGSASPSRSNSLSPPRSEDDDSTHSVIVAPLSQLSLKGRRGVTPAAWDAERDTIPPSTDEAVAALRRNEGEPFTPPLVRVPDHHDVVAGGQDQASEVASENSSTVLSWSRALVIDETTPERVNPAHERGRTGRGGQGSGGVGNA
jgi:hypothetical protein